MVLSALLSYDVQAEGEVSSKEAMPSLQDGGLAHPAREEISQIDNCAGYLAPRTPGVSTFRSAPGGVVQQTSSKCMATLYLSAVPSSEAPMTYYVYLHDKDKNFVPPPWRYEERVSNANVLLRRLRETLKEKIGVSTIVDTPPSLFTLPDPCGGEHVGFLWGSETEVLVVSPAPLKEWYDAKKNACCKITLKENA